ncbi:MAG: extracellular solute-binding protein [Limnochordia bacterium]|nr:extracellular solute-binding protein [Limnochordia bacterium]
MIGILLVLSALAITRSNEVAAERIVVWVRANNNVDLFELIAEEYMKHNPGVEVEIWPHGGNLNKLTIAVLGGTAPDLVEIDGPQSPQLAIAGIIRPITKYAEQDGLSADEFWPTAYWRGWFDGELYSLPVNADANFLLVWYKNLFERVGLDGDAPPQYISDVDTYSHKLAERDDEGKLTRVGIVPWRQYEELNSALAWSWAFGGSFFDEGTWEFTATHPNNLRMFQWMQSFAQKYFPAEVEPLRGSEYMHIWNQSAAMSLMVGDQILTLRLRHPDEDIGIGVMPRDAETGYQYPEHVGGWNMAVTSSSTNAELAWDFMKFALASPEGTSFQYPSLKGEASFWCPGYRKSPLYDEYLMTGDILHVAIQNLLAKAVFYPPRVPFNLGEGMVPAVRDIIAISKPVSPANRLDELQEWGERVLMEWKFE